MTPGVVPGPSASASPGNSLEYRRLGPTSDLLTQNSGIGSRNLAGSDSGSGLRAPRVWAESNCTETDRHVSSGCFGPQRLQALKKPIRKSTEAGRVSVIVTN